MIKKNMLLILLSTVFRLYGNPTANSCQMLLTLADNWSSTTGLLQKFERNSCDDEWHSIGESIPVSLGRNGLGWGIGLHNPQLLEEECFQHDPQIFEGAGRAPAGAFSLHIAFGIDPTDIRLNYIPITPHVWGVDDINSQYYNRIVDDQHTAKDWNSAEDMQHYADEGLYELGAFIEHNYDEPIPGKGSCFFIHIHRRPGAPTAGCTAFEKEKVFEVLNWLDPNKNPVIVQLPLEAFAILQDNWNLPTITHN